MALTAARALAIARGLGFARARVAPIEPTRRHDAYVTWLASGHAGDMSYLADRAHVDARADPRALLATARTVLSVALAYPRDEPVAPDRLLRGRIARYARGEDYHLVMRDRLVALGERIAAELGHPVAVRACVDSAPVLERAWAERAGTGFIGKNTMWIAPGLGSYAVLGELLLAVELAPDDDRDCDTNARDARADAAPARDASRPRCGSCTSCLDICPTRAFVAPYSLDARRCISYLTIEHRGAIPRELRAAIGTWIFGCDLCQEVCPFNAGAGEPADPALAPRSLAHSLPDLVALATAGANQLRQFVRRTALRRVTRDQLRRNVAVALGNTGDPRAIATLVGLLASASPVVRAHAVWALGQLGAYAELAAHRDDDPEVRAELALATAEIDHSRRTPPPP